MYVSPRSCKTRSSIQHRGTANSSRPQLVFMTFARSYAPTAGSTDTKAFTFYYRVKKNPGKLSDKITMPSSGALREAPHTLLSTWPSTGVPDAKCCRSPRDDATGYWRLLEHSALLVAQCRLLSFFFYYFLLQSSLPVLCTCPRFRPRALHRYQQLWHPKFSPTRTLWHQI